MRLKDIIILQNKIDLVTESVHCLLLLLLLLPTDERAPCCC
jgi:hypothetical protein